MKFFEVNSDPSTGFCATSIHDEISRVLNLRYIDLDFIPFSDSYKLDTYTLSSIIKGNIYWTSDINTEHQNYKKIEPYKFFNTKNEELLITSLDFSDLIPNKSMAEILKSPLHEAQGYTFVEKLLSMYDSSLSDSGLVLIKNKPDAILVLDLILLLAEDPSSYLKGMQTKWNEYQKDKPEIYVLTGERNAE